jgi:hypothetical protein
MVAALCPPSATPGALNANPRTPGAQFLGRPTAPGLTAAAMKFSGHFRQSR